MKKNLINKCIEEPLHSTLSDESDIKILYSIGVILIEYFNLIDDGIKYKRMALRNFISRIYDDETLEDKSKELCAEPYRLELEVLEKLLESRKTSK